MAARMTSTRRTPSASVRSVAGMIDQSRLASLIGKGTWLIASWVTTSASSSGGMPVGTGISRMTTDWPGTTALTTAPPEAPRPACTSRSCTTEPTVSGSAINPSRTVLGGVGISEKLTSSTPSFVFSSCTTESDWEFTSSPRVGPFLFLIPNTVFSFHAPAPQASLCPTTGQRANRIPENGHRASNRQGRPEGKRLGHPGPHRDYTQKGAARCADKAKTDPGQRAGRQPGRHADKQRRHRQQDKADQDAGHRGAQGVLEDACPVHLHYQQPDTKDGAGHEADHKRSHQTLPAQVGGDNGREHGVAATHDLHLGPGRLPALTAGGAQPQLLVDHLVGALLLRRGGRRAVQVQVQLEPVVGEKVEDDIARPHPGQRA